MRIADLRYTFPVVALFTVIACRDGTADADRAAVRDNAGVGTLIGTTRSLSRVDYVAGSLLFSWAMEVYPRAFIHVAR